MHVRVPTRAIPVDLRLRSGARLHVTLHLGEAVHGHDGAETMEDFLEAERHFLPVHDDGGKLLLLNRDGVVYVRIPHDAPVVSQRVSQGMRAVDVVRVALPFTDEDADLVGVLANDLSPDDTRVSDVVNGPERFLAIEDDRGIVFFQKHLVVSLSF
jgi:hypothetical protein